MLCVCRRDVCGFALLENNMAEWALFNDEGMLAEYASRVQAEAAADDEKAKGDTHAYAGPICEDHPEQCAWNCEICNSDEEQ